MGQLPELPTEIWEIILDHLKFECCTVDWLPVASLVLPPYSQIKYVNKLFYSKLYYPPPSPIDPHLSLPRCLPLIAIQYHDVKINIELAPTPSEYENS